MSWIDQVASCPNVYVYQAALLCEDCGRRIIAQLSKKKVLDDGDSDTFPQGSYPDGGGESDAAHFCDSGPRCVNAISVTSGHKIGCPLENPLTREGADNIREMVVRHDLLSVSTFSRRVGRILHQVWEPYCEPGDTLRRVLVPKLPASLTTALRTHGYPSTSPIMLADSENAYLVASKRLGEPAPGSEVYLLRCPVTADGEFDQIDFAMIPQQAISEAGEEKMLREAVSEMAWD